MSNKKSDTKALSTLATKQAIKDLMKDVHAEAAKDVADSVKDYAKGALKWRYTLEKQIESIDLVIQKVDQAIVEAQEGNIEPLKQLGVPSQYLSEETVKLNNIDWRD